MRSLWNGSRKLRFLVVGGWNTLFGYLAFAGLYLLLSATLHYLAIATLAHFLAVAQSYATQRRLVFRSSESIMAEFIRFNISHLGTLLFGLGAMWLLVDGLGMTPLVAQAITVGGVVILSYVLHSRVSFAPTSRPENAPEVASAIVTIRPSSADAPDRLTCLALAYLLLPAGMYFLGWFRLYAGIPLLVLLGFATWRALRVAARMRTAWPPLWLGALAVTAAVAWSVFGGAGHFFYANAHDWHIRDAVLRDLVAVAWPPAYDVGEEDLLLLRAPVAYFLPAAGLAKLIGAGIADRLLWLWTALGVTIFFLLLPLSRTRPSRVALALLVVVAFSGMDIAGFMFPDYHEGNFPLKGAFIDWWIKPPPLVSYWANTTNLFWNPNHTLPAWISIALFFRHWQHSGFTSIAALLAAVLPLWSPFALIGMLPFLALLAVQHRGRQTTDPVDLPVLGACFLILAAITITLVVPPSGIAYGVTLISPPEHGGWIYRHDISHFLTFAENYLLFVIFEFGLMALLLSGLVDRRLFATAVITLVLLPFVSIGPGNDLAMRGSIPALGILCIAAIIGLSDSKAEMPSWRRLALVIVLAIGAVTPYFEFDRAVSRRPWQPNAEFTLLDATNGQVAPHYMVPLSRSPVAFALRPPGRLTNAVDWSTFCLRAHPRNNMHQPGVAFAWRSNRNDLKLRRELRQWEQCRNAYFSEPRNPEVKLRDLKCP
jgi:putative flippase GtrA